MAVTIRLLKDDESDYKLLTKWYQQKEIYTHFEQKVLTYEEIVNKYKPRTKTNAKVPVFMIEYDNAPVGIIQYQQIDEENQKLYSIKNTNAYEIDIFIGELNLHNKGIGRNAIDLICDYLKNKKEAKLLVMCPLKDNISAIKCYEKCEFEILRDFQTLNTIGELKSYALMMRKSKKNNE